MLSKDFNKFLTTMAVLAATAWAYHFFTGATAYWSWFNHMDKPVTSGDVIFMAIFVVGALYRSADAIVTAMTRREGVEAVASALAA
jgi:hypothetical protein